MPFFFRIQEYNSNFNAEINISLEGSGQQKVYISKDFIFYEEEITNDKFCVNKHHDSFIEFCEDHSEFNNFKLLP